MNLKPIAGIDVSKYFSEMVVISPTNEIIARLTIHHNNPSDFDRAIEILKKVEEDFAARPTIVMEATGHYHKILSRFFTSNGWDVAIINPIQSNSIKNAGVRKVKNDKIDALWIALTFRLTNSTTAQPSSEILDCLKNLCRQYYNLSDELTSYKYRLTSVVDQIMLNFKEVFPDICSKTSLAILENYPTPNDILGADTEKLISIIQQTSKKSYQWAKEKYELLIAKAKEFKSFSISNLANVTMLKVYINMVLTLQQNIDKIFESINQLVQQSSQTQPSISENINLLQSIPGIGFLSAATILAEIGDFEKFSKPNKLVAFFGIDPSVNQSGQFVGTKNKMSKRGSKILRRILFTIALANIRTKRDSKPCNPVLFEYYQKKCQQKPKKVALGAVMRKIICIIFAVMRDKKPFELRTPEEHIRRCFNNTAVYCV
ncbi:transposase IS116/IS110/IS902 family protein [Caldicellulosiruptor hydrothermalis 108]|uniref:Transposase IS116/IS110/IS902 family protein n=1 Tax=Caldicellulosiruptor hydrothermalis (strain DSM 18901 / VKM B-2411 / 108) TaxID=632292 RepID=E4Q768_CALH1|nr:IS110 family transposase [Caldicellulosiruptor hydrothermalis]ADQ06581.1 transposase IS116/IS110/IS902 family protein [Caldicellulosiruptor hydrothermalis 108]ADQ07425.1 transposase IS116/IS110/IS902 family protein [Caldicellulosiruptor hydrothermalis 108]ADQ07850.1 transposase IS116/IS110/IS902 family protein [Caldicellulosiruptor hydrothermalis 108]ADQ08165.1 transposase IS116/IS110/IS902 family protein [Caldicellulosiruptor hydrothermalis 108]ADQ08196.1 transposase IS116/IS110/IS902 fami